MTMGHKHLILFDGECGLCHRFVRFVLARDARGTFAFLPLKTRAGQRLLAKHQAPSDLDSVAVIEAHGTDAERMRVKSDAALFVAEEVGRPRWLMRLARRVPVVLRDVVYDFVARVRFRIFGTADVCALPTPATRARFLADSSEDAPG